MTAEKITDLVNEAVSKAASEHSMAYGHRAVEVQTHSDRFVSFVCRCGRTFAPPPAILALAEESADRALELQVERGINDQLRGVIGEMADALVMVLGGGCPFDVCVAARAALRKAGREVAPPGWKINNPGWPSGEGEHLIRQEEE